MRSFAWQRFPFFIVFALLGLVTIFLIIAGSGERVAAASECNVVLSLDRSASIGSNLRTMKDNIENLFTRLHSDYPNKGIRLGFWTFSHDPDPAANYNKYFINYTPVDGTAVDHNNFVNEIEKIDLDGQTNYEQALSYSNGSPNPNDSTGTITSLRTNADVVAIISDGIPNFPGDEDPNDASNIPVQSEISAHDAVNKFKADSSDPSNPPIMMGFVLAGVSQRSMQYAINGDKNNGDNVGPFGFSTIESSLVAKIVQACDARNPTGYSITPTARLDSGSAVRSGGSVNVHFDATLTDNQTGAAVTTSWSTVRVVLKPGADERKIQFGQTGSSCGSTTNPYCDNMSCSQIQSGAYFGSAAESCSFLESCNTSVASCGSYNAVGDLYPIDRADTVPDGLELGTKVCYMFALNSPASGKSNRFSQAVCVMIGKSPTVQVWGGDVRVGRPFVDDTSGDITAADSGVYTSLFGMPDNKHYGSWAEYGVFAPNTIKSIASMAGADGYIGAVPGTTGDIGCDTTALNRLTFANVVSGASDTCGKFGSIGTIPNVVSAYAAWNRSGTQLSNTNPLALSDWNSTAGRQRYEVMGSGAVHLKNSAPGAITIDAGKQIVLDLRGHDVFIDGDIQYADEKSAGVAYKDLNDLPQLIIMANNITVDPSVGRVDAWLIANGRTAVTDGTVKTCIPNAAGARVTATMCNGQLRVNGPIMARHLELWRTGGAEDSRSSCDKDAATPDCSDAKNSAEVIDLPGTTLMWSALRSGTPRALTTYTVELPPYF